MIRFSCSSCGNTLKASTEHAGKKAKCSKCSSIQVIPKTANVQAVSKDSEVFCICGECKANFYAKDTSSDKSIACPKCPSMFSLPAKNKITSDQSTIRFACSSCNQKYALPVKYAGKKFGCVKCKTPCSIPLLPEPEKAEAEDDFMVMDSESFDWNKIDQYIETHEQEADKNIQVREEPQETQPEYYEDPLKRIPTSFVQKAPRTPSIGTKIIVPAVVIGYYILILIGLFLIPANELPDKTSMALGYNSKTIKKINKGDIGGPDNLGQMIDYVDTGSFEGQIDYTSVIAALSIGEITNIESSLEYVGPAYGIGAHIVKSTVEFDTGDRREVIVASTVQRETFDIYKVSVNYSNGDEIAATGNESFEDIQAEFDEIVAHNTILSPNQIIYLFLAIILTAFILTISTWRVLDMAGAPGWACLIPIYSMMAQAEAGGRNSLIGLACTLLAGIPVIGTIIFYVLYIYITIGIAEVFNRGILFGIGLGLLPPVFFPILAFSENRYD